MHCGNLVASEAGNVGTVAIVSNAEEAANLTASNLAPYVAVVDAMQLQTQPLQSPLCMPSTCVQLHRQLNRL